MANFFSRLFNAPAGEPAPPSLTQQLAAAVNADDLPQVQRLLDQGARPDDPDPQHDWTATQRAAANGRTEVLRLLLTHGADVHQCKRFSQDTLLHLAANGMHPSVFAVLKDAGLDVNVRGDMDQTALFTSASLDDVSGVLELLLLGADPALRNASGQTAAEVALAREQEADPDRSWSTANARAVLEGWSSGGPQ